MKHKGGKGKKAPYETVVMRIPTPIEQDVRCLIEEFFSKGVTGLDEGVTGIEDKGVTGLDEGVTGIEYLDVTPIEELRLPITLYNALKRAQINTIDQLKAAKYDLNSFKKIGKESVKKIESALQRYDSRYSD